MDVWNSINVFNNRFSWCMIVTTLPATAAQQHRQTAQVELLLSPIYNAMTIDQSGNLYVQDGKSPALLRKVTPTGVVTTIPANGAISGPINGFAIDKSGNLFIADLATRAIRKLTPGGVSSLIAGGQIGTNDGVGAAATFTNLNGITLDDSGNL